MMTNCFDHIAVFDWGTTHLRAHVVGRDGTVQKTIKRDSAIKNDTGHSIQYRFSHVASELEQTYGPLPCILVGMIGSNFGWQEVAMLAGPISLADLAENLFEVVDAGDRQAVIIPGVTARSVAGSPDMMRGEETQVFGVLRSMEASCMICLPGTHTKWVRCDKGAITSITTAMTGEIFAMLQRHSVLKGTLSGASAQLDSGAFDEGVALASTGLGALQLAFSTRARSLSDVSLSPDAASSYLSGLMIGAEVMAMVPYVKTDVAIVGDPALGEFYARAFAAVGTTPRLIDGSVAVAAGARELFDQYITKRTLKSPA